MAVIIGLEQLMSSEVRKSNRLMGEATDAGRDFDAGGTHNQHSPRWPGRVLVSS